MEFSRRKFFQTLGTGAAISAASQLSVASFASAAAFESAKISGGPILLNENENVYGPSAKVTSAIRSAASSANRYPDQGYAGLKKKIADLHRVTPEQVVMGCGSTEILRVVVEALLRPGKRVVQASPTYEAIEVSGRTFGAEVVSVPLTKEFAHDLPGMLAHVDGNTPLVYICNPNNPTATLTPRRDLETFIAKLPANCHVFIDEAYHHYAGESSMYRSFIDDPIQDERVIVSRTFSKIYALAGLRLGYAIASAELANRVDPYLIWSSINGIAVKAATAALDDVQSVHDFTKRNADTRQEFFNQAMARMLKPIDSHTNFVMMNVEHPCQGVIEHFQKNGILIGRRFPLMDTYVRISLGTSSQMNEFWRVWDTLPFAKMMQMNHLKS